MTSSECRAKDRAFCRYHGYVHPRRGTYGSAPATTKPLYPIEIATDSEVEDRLLDSETMKFSDTLKLWNFNKFTAVETIGSMNELFATYHPRTYKQFLSVYFKHVRSWEYIQGEIERFRQLADLTPREAHNFYLRRVFDQAWEGHYYVPKRAVELLTEKFIKNGTWTAIKQSDEHTDAHKGVDLIVERYGQVIGGIQLKSNAFFHSPRTESARLYNIRKNATWGHPVVYMNTNDILKGEVKFISVEEVLAKNTDRAAAEQALSRYHNNLKRAA